MCEEYVPISAFVTPHGHFQWRYMHFGLRNAPATFQRLMLKVLARLEDFTCAFLDDVEVFSNSWSEHMQYLRIVISSLSRRRFDVKEG